MEEKLKEAVFNIGKSHSELSSAEYDRNPSFNSSHFAYKAEIKLIEYLQEVGLLDEFLNYNLDK